MLNKLVNKRKEEQTDMKTYLLGQSMSLFSFQVGVPLHWHHLCCSEMMRQTALQSS